MSNKKHSFSSSFSFYLLAIGSACGLGNLWRFPYIVGENGGGAFLLLYVFLALTIGLALMIAELMIGRYTGAGVLAASRKAAFSLNNKKVQTVGWLSLIITAAILSYYSVISGWVVHYLTQFVVSLMKINSIGQLSKTSVAMLIESGWLQFLLASVHLIVTSAIVINGFGEDFEKRVASLLPFFGIFVVLLLYGSLSLDSTKDVLRFLFYPDFSKLNWSSLGHAVGHVFFTLSLGFGTMITFGGYLRSEDHLPGIGFRVTFVDTIISIIAVLLVFPIAFSGAKQISTDPSLLFDVMPSFLSSIKGGVLFGLIFFLFLWLAALNASVGLLETLVANIVERRKNIGRRSAVLYSSGAILLITIFPAFSGSIFKNIRIAGRSIIEIFDTFLINVALPIAVLGVIVLFFAIIDKTARKKMFVRSDSSTTIAIYSHWEFVLKWVVPIIIVLALVMMLIGLIL